MNKLLAGAVEIALEAAGRIGNSDLPQCADSPNLLSACRTQTDKLLDSAQGLLASYVYMAATEVKFYSAVYQREKAFLPIPL
jgi:hypothetical protein